MTEVKWEARRYFYKGTAKWYRVWRESGNRKQQLESRWLWEQEYGPIREGYVIHHIDGNPLNNDLDNLQIKTDGEHRAFHARLRGVYKIIDGIEHKRCPKCSLYKLPDCFSVRSRGGLCGYCKGCDNTRSRGYRAENRERINARRRKRYAEKKAAQKA